MNTPVQRKLYSWNILFNKNALILLIYFSHFLNLLYLIPFYSNKGQLFCSIKVILCKLRVQVWRESLYSTPFLSNYFRINISRVTTFVYFISEAVYFPISQNLCLRKFLIIYLQLLKETIEQNIILHYCNKVQMNSTFIVKTFILRNIVQNRIN